MTDVHREVAIDDIWSVNIASITTVPLLVFLGILIDQQLHMYQRLVVICWSTLLPSLSLQLIVPK